MLRCYVISAVKKCTQDFVPRNRKNTHFPLKKCYLIFSKYSKSIHNSDIKCIDILSADENRA
jgi:hypothetical protein